MKRMLAFLLAMIMVLSMAAMTACQDPSDPPAENPKDETPGDKPEDPGTPGPDEPACTHEDADSDYKCDKCGAEMEKPDCTHEDADSDYKCDNCGADMTPGVDPADQKKVDAVIERINKIEEITRENYTKFKTKISNARTYYDKLTDTQKAMISEDLLKKLTDAEELYAAFKAADEKAEALTINKLITSSPTIDGVMNVEYLLGAALKATTEAGTTVTFRFLLDDEYLYVLEDRKDAMLVKPSDYNVADGDNSVIYFAKDGATAGTAQVSLYGGTPTTASTAALAWYRLVASGSQYELQKQ